MYEYFGLTEDVNSIVELTELFGVPVDDVQFDMVSHHMAILTEDNIYIYHKGILHNCIRNGIKYPHKCIIQLDIAEGIFDTSAYYNAIRCKGRSDPHVVYLIRLVGVKDSTYKVGVSCNFTTRKFSFTERGYTVVRSAHITTFPIIAYEYERYLKQYIKKYCRHYVPKYNIGGHKTECFTLNTKSFECMVKDNAFIMGCKNGSFSEDRGMNTNIHHIKQALTK